MVSCRMLVQTQASKRKGSTEGGVAACEHCCLRDSEDTPRLEVREALYLMMKFELFPVFLGDILPTSWTREASVKGAIPACRDNFAHTPFDAQNAPECLFLISECARKSHGGSTETPQSSLEVISTLAISGREQSNDNSRNLTKSYSRSLTIRTKKSAD